MLLDSSQAWRASDELLEQLVEAAPTALIVLDLDLVVLDANREACELLNRRRLDLVHRPVLDVWSSPRLRAAIQDLLDNARRGLGQIGVEGPVAVGTVERWARWSASRLTDRGTTRLLLVGRDVRELRSLEQRRRADDALGRIAATCDCTSRAIPRLLRALCRTLGWDVGELWTVDAVAGVLRCDGVWAVAGHDMGKLADTCREVSLRPGEGLPGSAWARGRLVQLSSLAVCPRVERAGIEMALALPIRGRDGVFGVVTLGSRGNRRLDGSQLAALESLGTQIGLLFDRIRVRENLRRTETALRSIHEIGTRAGTTLAEKLEALLHEGCRWFGTKAGALMRTSPSTGEPIAIVTSVAQRRGCGAGTEALDRGALQSALLSSPWFAQVAQRQACSCIERVSRSASGSWPSFIGIPVRLRGEPFGVLGFASGEPRRRRFSATDREILGVMAQWIGAEIEREELQEQVVESERLAAVGLTAATFAHEVSNPLANMALACEIVERDLSNPAGRARDGLALVKKEVARLGRLLDEFRALSRAQVLRREVSCLFELIASVLRDFEPNFTAAGIVHELEGRPMTCFIDRDKMRQVLMNLVKNAVEAMLRGGLLTVRLEGFDDHARLEIADTGGGVPHGIDVFAPFATTKREGTGLGLSVARQLVTAHQGRLSYDTTPGSGTRFWIELPRYHVHEPANVAHAALSHF